MRLTKLNIVLAATMAASVLIALPGCENDHHDYDHDRDRYPVGDMHDNDHHDQQHDNDHHDDSHDNDHHDDNR